MSRAVDQYPLVATAFVLALTSFAVLRKLGRADLLESSPVDTLSAASALGIVVK